MEIFSPFRVVGSVCGDIPLSSTTLYGAPVLMVATGRTFQLFRGKELSMLRGGPHFLKRVRAVAQAGKYRFVAEGPRIHGFVHHKPLWTCVHNEITQSKVEHLLAADELLFSIGQDKRVAVRQVKTGVLLNEFLIEHSEHVRALVLPTGYTNKLLVGTAEGSLHLYNFRSGVCVWYTQCEPGAQLLSITTSHYKDIIAYGTSTGKISVLNMGTNDEIMTLVHKGSGAITSLAFRTDKSILVSGTSAGEIALWDLEQRCLEGLLTRSKEVQSENEVLETPHTDVVHSIIVLPTDHAAIVTAGADNALLQFRFDTVDGLGMLVRERRGHMGNCTTARFYNNDLLLTTGMDRALRVTHVFSDRASWELSQGRLGRRGREKQMGREALKMTPAIAISSCTARNYQWASVVSLHEASAQICGWRMDVRALECKLSGITTSVHTARCVAMSDCGNFAIVGYSSGNVTIINLQNRSVRQLFDEALHPSDRAHLSSVECVEVSCGNNIIITAGLDCRIKLWGLHDCRLRSVAEVGYPMNKSCVHQPSSLFIVAQHFTIRVYNCNPDAGVDIKAPVREFNGHNAPITALALAPDSHRFVVSASGDAALLVWDLAAAACVGQYRFTAPATSLSFHPDALFMITTHAGERGSFLWTNNLRYGFVPEVRADPKSVLLEQLPLLHFPIAHGEAEDDAAVAHNGGEGQRHQKQGESEEEEEEAAATADAGHKIDGTVPVEAELFDVSKDIALLRRQVEREQRARLESIFSDGLRLAGVPRSMWLNLTLLEQIKEKNQPLLPPKKRDVPFFLPTTQELRPTFLLTASSNKDKETAAALSHIIETPLLELTPVQHMLLHNEYEALMSHFLSLETPQALDLEIKRAVDYSDGGFYTQEEIQRIKDCLRGLLGFIAAWLRRRENVDLIQGVLSDVIRSHGSLLTKCGEEFVALLQEVAQLQNRVRYSLDHLVGYPACLLGTFSGSLFYTSSEVTLHTFQPKIDRHSRRLASSLLSVEERQSHDVVRRERHREELAARVKEERQQTETFRPVTNHYIKRDTAGVSNSGGGGVSALLPRKTASEPEETFHPLINTKSQRMVENSACRSAQQQIQAVRGRVRTLWRTHAGVGTSEMTLSGVYAALKEIGLHPPSPMIDKFLLALGLDKDYGIYCVPYDRFLKVFTAVLRAALIDPAEKDKVLPLNRPTPTMRRVSHGNSPEKQEHVRRISVNSAFATYVPRPPSPMSTDATSALQDENDNNNENCPNDKAMKHIIDGKSMRSSYTVSVAMSRAASGKFSTKKCIIGPKMRETPYDPLEGCTFAPAINKNSRPVCSVKSAENKERKGQPQRKAPVVTCNSLEEREMEECTFVPNTSYIHKCRNSLAWWTRGSFIDSAVCSTSLSAEDISKPCTQNGNNKARRGYFAGEEKKQEQTEMSRPSCVPLSAGFDKTVQRMIEARKKYRPGFEDMLRSSTDEPSKPLQPTVVKPFILQADARCSKREKQKPLLYVDVDLPSGKRRRIDIYKGDSVTNIARGFSLTYGLSEDLCKRLEVVLEQKLREVLYRNEDVQWL